MPDRSTSPSAAPAPEGAADRLRRFAPLALIALGAALGAWAFGDRLSFEALEANRAALLDWRDAGPVRAAAIYMAVYVAMVAFSIPGAIWLTLAGGFLFGTWVAAGLIVVAATVGAALIFLAARSGFGDLLRKRAEGWLARLERGVRDNEVSFMLTLRLVPAVPFFIANLAPAFLGVRFRTYLWTTLVGIAPATAIYASVGAGLGEVFARGERPDLGVIFSPPVLLPLLGLAALAAAPALYKAVRGR
ncbi:MAG: TVP38/TMEM64 family protein [Rubrimonas sp.]|uniref:TVP38/TMEM64 family protein n=1 Tax=Rubrimonas sp. TaxID=2036015 RepID=UPI002FDCF5D8